ncbi:N-acetylglucosamine kinase [Kribbella amoyensis]|nr:BadF/BadG/BcrA/BcrD ATPase family protein [Kribbella amoyensis]
MPSTSRGSVADNGPATVAIDGGQSSLRLRVLADGRTGEGPGFVHGGDTVQDTLAAVRQAATDARLDEPVDVVALGLCGLPNDVVQAEALADGVAEVLGATEVRVCEDMVTAHAGALADGYGVVVAAGTGVVCLAIDRDRSWHKVDGHGYLFGDAGSAFAIGRAGLVAVLRARDGRGPATALATAHLDPWTYYSSPTVVDDVARFAPTVLGHAADGDAVAGGIVDQAVADLGETIRTAVATMRPGEEIPVACVGGLFDAGDQLLEPLARQLDDRAALTKPLGTPLDGAARLARGTLQPYDDLVTVHRRPE